ncbi:hypothetical protein DWW31_11050 [Clostridium sp. AF15-17LB]|nr:hypothetical protein DWW31_11050 [Clostridium sp. AF15-17LB]
MSNNKYYCKIDGVVHNLSDVQDVLDGKSDRNITLIMHEDHGMDIISAHTFESVLRYHNNEIPADYDEALRRWQEYNMSRIPQSPPKPRCSRCGSTDIGKWTASVGSVNTLYVPWKKCKNCGNMWM